jgi:hypothetical protein
MLCFFLVEELIYIFMMELFYLLINRNLIAYENILLFSLAYIILVIQLFEQDNVY